MLRRCLEQIDILSDWTNGRDNLHLAPSRRELQTGLAQALSTKQMPSEDRRDEQQESTVVGESADLASP